MNIRISVFLTCCCAGFVAAQQSSENKQENVLIAAVSEYRCYLAKDRSAELNRLTTPILSWTNPLRNTPDGYVFLWTSAGVPQAVSCIYTYGDKNIDHEFQSLSTEGILALRNGKIAWQPQKGGVEFRDVHDDSPPADTGTKRLVQMRSIARQVVASVDSESERHELRLLPQPIYRYPEDRDRMKDGAIFAYVQATDPELLLLLEGDLAGDNSRWRYSFARMTDRELRAQIGEKVVWSVPKWKWQERDPKASYIKFTEKIQR